MGLLPMDIDILPPDDDRIFKLLMTSPEAKPGLMKLISGVIGREVVDVMIHNNELPPGDIEEKAERLDVNCKINDGSQINLEMQASRMKEDIDGEYRNLKGKSIYYLTDLHSSQPSKGVLRYDKLSRTYQITFCSYTIFSSRTDYVNSFSMRHDITGELLMSISQNEQERAIFRSRRKFQTDYESDMTTSWDNGGKSKAFEIALKAIEMNMTNDIIVKLTGLSAKEVENLKS